MDGASSSASGTSKGNNVVVQFLPRVADDTVSVYAAEESTLGVERHASFCEQNNFSDNVGRRLSGNV